MALWPCFHEAIGASSITRITLALVSTFTQDTDLTSRAEPFDSNVVASSFLRSWTFRTCYNRNDVSFNDLRRHVPLYDTVRHGTSYLFKRVLHDISNRVTGRVCPSRWARARAWSSSEGFHCGSRRCTREAAVRSSPQAPHAIVTSMTRILGSSRSCCTAKLRLLAATLPSTRTDWMMLLGSLRSPRSIMSRLDVQDENTTLVTG
jgi:hypothetical protein